MYHTIDTNNGTLSYQVIKDGEGFRGQVEHDLHKNPRLKGKVLSRRSKEYKTTKGATNWLDKQIEIQNESA